MTTAAMAQCDYCGTGVPTAETFQPYRGAVRCRDVGACERRQLRRYDPTLLRDEDLPVPVTGTVRPGTACAACGAVGLALYARMPGQWVCTDRDACQRRALEDMSAWSDSSPDRLISSADMRVLAAPASAEVAPPRRQLDPAEMAALAASEALGRKRH